jgi:hypothetical protein
MSTSSSSIANSTASMSISPVGRVGAAFISPSSLFEDVKRNTNWWPAFLLLVIGGLIFCFAVQKQVGWGHAYEAVLRQNPRQQAQFAQMPAAQAASARALGAKITAGIAWGFPAVILLTTAVSAAVLLGTLNFGFGGKASYGELFSVYMYASLPFVVHSLLAAIALFAGLDSSSFLISNPVGSNPGYYLAPDTAPWLMALASSFDLFTLWMLALLVIGCSVVAKVSRTSATVAVVGWWVLIMIVKVGAAAFQG